MAVGPFKSAPPLQDIAPAAQRGGFARAPGIVDATKAVADALVPSIRDAHIKGLQEDVLGQTKTVKEFLKLARTPSLLLSEFGTEAIENPAVRQAIADFVKIRDATEQGKLPQQFALERLEMIQNQAIVAAPEFEKEIRQAMIQATGQDPTKTLFAQLLSTTRKALTPQQKAFNAVTQDAAENGITFDQQMELNNKSAQRDLQSALFETRAAQGKLRAFDIIPEVNRQAGKGMLNVIGLMRKELVRNPLDALNPKFVQFLKRETGVILASSKATMIAQLQDLDATAVANATQPLDDLAETLNLMIDDGSMLALVRDENALKTLIIEGEILNIPALAAAYIAGGKPGFVQILKYNQLAKTELAKETLADLDPTFAATRTLQVTTGEVVKDFPNVFRGPSPLTVKEKNIRTVSSAVALQADLTEEQRTLAQERAFEVDPEKSFITMGNAEVVARNKKSTVGKAHVIAVQESQSGLLAAEYFQISNTPGFDATRFKFVNDKLTFEARPEEIKGVGAGINDLARQFIGRFNRANDISAINHRAGILPAKSWSSTQMYWKAIIKPIPPEEKPPASQEIELEVIFDSEGNLIFKD